MAADSMSTRLLLPSTVERWRRSALFAVVMERMSTACRRGRWTTIVALEVDGISKAEVRGICGELDTELSGFGDGPLSHVEVPTSFLDATYPKGRVDWQVVSRAVVVVTG